MLQSLADRAEATIEDTAINGYLLHIPREREAEMLRVLEDLGIDYRRDDEVFGVLCVESLYQ